MQHRKPNSRLTPQGEAVAGNGKTVVLAETVDDGNDSLLFGSVANGNLKSAALRAVGRMNQAVQIFVGGVLWRERSGAKLKMLERWLV